jgi:iron complex outermembrane receptor protein
MGRIGKLGRIGKRGTGKAGLPVGGVATVFTLLALSSHAVSADTPTGRLSELSLEELGDVEITSVSRQAEPLSEAAASVYVITADDIRRSGATQLPEALRLAPNLQVARVNSNSYAISARGFNNALGNKLLVLIDGRTVYTPLFSGVFWDSQQVVLADVERIEVISGPGGTLWGANAVNGIINVITRPASQSQGGLVALSGGEYGWGGDARFGGRIGSGHYRAFVQRHRTDPSRDPAGNELADRWDTAQTGFRADWGDSAQSFKVIGGAYRGESSVRLFGPVEVSGANLLARWRRQLGADSSLRVQAYYDRAERHDPIQFHDRMEVADLEFHHAFAPGRHAVLWGGGYRVARDRADPGLLVAFIPAHKYLHWSHLFVQDEIALSGSVDLTLGVKLEHNDYTGLESLPSARISWKTDRGDLLWGALSRAVRTPSRIDREFFLPSFPPFLIRGGPDFESEVANVAEIGFRSQPTPALSYSVTVFHHDFDRLRSGQPVAGGGFQVQNGSEGTTSGIEAWGTLQLSDGWRLSGGLAALHKRLRLKPGALDPDGTTALGNDPDYQWQLRSTTLFGDRYDFTMTVRGVDDLPSPAIPGYTTLDLGLGWRPNEHVELRLIVDDALDAGRIEFAPGLLSAPSEFGRSTRLNLLWTW